MTIKAVVFDVGNVLIEWHPERFYDGVIGETRRRALFAEVPLVEMNERVDLGHPFRDTVYALADEHPEWRDEIRLWHDRWIEMARPAIDLSVHVKRLLQAKGIPVFSLTNFGVDSYALAAKHYPFLSDFNRDFISGHLRVMKPDARFYEILEETSGMSGEDLIFTDDRADNIAAAAARGWRTHLFQDPEGWANRLIEEGLLTESEVQA